LYRTTSRKCGVGREKKRTIEELATVSLTRGDFEGNDVALRIKVSSLRKRNNI
jgi:hypothetical protein